jgi:hypothetical protein
MQLHNSYEVRDCYLYVKTAGEFDPSSAKSVLLQWIENAKNHNLHRILCDITLVTGMDFGKPSIISRFTTSKFVAESIPKGFKLAVLETPKQLFNNGFVENILSNRGVIAKVTSNLDEALEWLGIGTSDKTAEGDGQEPAP